MSKRSVHLDLAHGIGPVTWPMGLTFLRLLLLPVFLYLLLADVPVGEKSPPTRHAALVVFAIMAVTDKLDGYLARKLNQASKLGAILDPLADKLLILATTVLLCFPAVAGEGFAIPKLVVIALYGKDAGLTLGALYILSRRGRVAISARLSGKASTVIQLALVMATLLAVDLQHLNEPILRKLLPILHWATGLSAVVAVIDYGLQGWKQLRTDEQKELATTDAHR